MSLEQSGDLTIVKAQEQLASSSEYRFMTSDDKDSNPGEGDSKQKSSESHIKKKAPHPIDPAASSKESKPDDGTAPEPPEKAKDETPNDPPENAEVDEPTEKSSVVEPEAKESAAESPAPSAAPTPEPNDPPVSPAPSAEPTAKKVEQAESPAPSAAPSPEPKDPPVSPAPSAEPTPKAKEPPVSPAPSAVPSPGPTDPPVKADPPTDDNDHDSCPGKTCSDCKTVAASLAAENGSMKTCVWKDSKCQVVEKAGAAPIHCDGDPPAADSEDVMFLNRPGQALFGGLVVLVFACILLRRYMKRSTNGRVNNTMNYGKYQGVNTASEDEDEEWGWDDEKPMHRNTLEMTHMGSGKRSMSGGSSSGSSPRQRRSVSPQMGNTVAAPVERKGFAVRKKGMNNPLHQPVAAKSTFSSSSSVVPKSSPSVAPPTARKIIPPTTDDFFAEMGVASKPRFPPSSTAVKPSAASATKRLHATVLRVESDDALDSAGGDNWGDDADLDDLLDS